METIRDKIKCDYCQEYFNKINPKGYIYLVPVDKKGFGGKELDFCMESCLLKYLQKKLKND